MPSAADLQVVEDPSASISPLPRVLRVGLAMVATAGLLSLVASTSLFCYLAYKIVTWRLVRSRPQPPLRRITLSRASNETSSSSRVLIKKAGPVPSFDVTQGARHRPVSDVFSPDKKPPLNQYVVLLLSLVWADMQQSMAALISFHWLAKRGLFAGTSTCTAQGWLISTGTLASGVFVTAIAAQTYLSVVRGYRLSTRLFYTGITTLWVLIYALSALGIAIKSVVMTSVDGTERNLYMLYSRAGAWVSLYLDKAHEKRVGRC